MALSTNKRNKIIAEWKAGLYKSYNAVSVKYGIDPKTVKKVLEGIEQSNTEIVEIGTAYESAKKSIKNPHEIKAIEKAIIERTIADDIHDEVMSGTLANIKNVKKRIETEQMFGIVDNRNAQETFDKALVTAGKAPRFATQNINVQTNVKTDTDIKNITKEDAYKAYFEIMKG